MNSKLSVIVPIYNVEQYLRQCLDSIVNQTYRNLEIILIDDGSPDNCGVICDEYKKKDERIKVIHKANGGLCAARNDGIRYSTGEWITFVDSDDWCELDYYEKMFKFLDDREVDIFCSGGHYKEYEKRRVDVKVFLKNDIITDKSTLKSLMAKVVCGNCSTIGSSEIAGGVWEKFYRRDFVVRRKILYDNSLKGGEDVYFNFIAFDKADSIGICPYIGYHYRMLSSSVSNGFNPQKPSILNVLLNDLYTYASHCEQNELLQEALEKFCFICIGNLCNCYYFHCANQASYKQIAKEVKEMKAWPYYHKAIFSKSNKYLSRRKMILKYLLRLPWIWPLSVIYKAKSRFTHWNFG